MTILGIDLGTTNSACAVWREGQAHLIPNRLGERLTPSVVGVDKDGVVMVGKAAKHRLVTHPDKTAAVFKRAMGSEHVFKLGGKQYSAVELSALVLRSLKEDAEAHLEESIEHAVISVPAYFNDVQRKATKLAGELAGLQVDRLINEPTAASLVHGLHDRGQGTRFLVLDLGGGTFDVTLVEHFSGVLEVHASAGDNFLGGEDFLNLLADRFCEEQNIDERGLSAQQRMHLFDVLESVKHRLSSEHHIDVNDALANQTAPWRIDRAAFEKLAQPLLRRAQAPIERALHDAGIGVDQIDEIVLVGGATRMPVFRSLVSRMFRRLPARIVDPDLVVAMGAGIQAGLKERSDDLDDVVLTDVCPYSLGTDVLNEADTSGKQGGLFLPIIERNTIVPVSVERTLVTAKDGQKQVNVGVYQGESRLVKNNIYLGELDVKVPKGPAGKEGIDVRFSYDMNGLLEVDVTVHSTGQVYSKTIVNSPGSLSDSELKESRERLAALKFHPRETEENRLLLARAERLYEGALGDKREYIGRIVSQFEQVLERQNAQEIKRAVSEIKEILDELERGDKLL